MVGAWITLCFILWCVDEATWTPRHLLFFSLVESVRSGHRTNTAVLVHLFVVVVFFSVFVVEIWLSFLGSFCCRRYWYHADDMFELQEETADATISNQLGRTQTIINVSGLIAPFRGVLTHSYLPGQTHVQSLALLFLVCALSSAKVKTPQSKFQPLPPC